MIRLGYWDPRRLGLDGRRTIWKIPAVEKVQAGISPDITVGRSLG